MGKTKAEGGRSLFRGGGKLESPSVIFFLPPFFPSFLPFFVSYHLQRLTSLPVCVCAHVLVR